MLYLFCLYVLSKLYKSFKNASVNSRLFYHLTLWHQFDNRMLPILKRIYYRKKNSQRDYFKYNILSHKEFTKNTLAYRWAKADRTFQIAFIRNNSKAIDKKYQRKRRTRGCQLSLYQHNHYIHVTVIILDK